ncbi:MAG: hypothetical protein JNN30_12900 [Rhodanobacteraceae bacterium]|nr:hypothetical protein [Rhodanobacteraceae bacterium]
MNSTQWTTPLPRAPRDRAWFGALVALFVAAITLRLGIGPAGTNLDESWSAVIAWAHVHGAQWGSDIVFTYGPLGWLNPYATYNPTLFSTFFLSQIALTLGIAITFGLAANLLHGRDRLLLLAGLVVLSPWLHSDVLLLCALVLSVAAVERIALTPAATRFGSTLALGAVATLCAALGLLKFSFFPLTIAAWVVGTLLLQLRGRTAAASGWFFAVPTISLAFWIANGQSLNGIGAYLHTSLDMAAGYGHAMGTSGELAPLLVGAAAGAIVAALLLLSLRHARGARLRTFALASFLALFVFIAWRASFTRADAAHVGFFLPLCAFAVAVLMGFLRERAGDSLRLFAAAAFVALTAGSLWLVAPKATVETYRTNMTYVSSIWRSLLDPASLRAQYDASRVAVRARLDLPRVRARVGAQRIDLLTNGQGLVLVNDLAFAPRPVFQSYAAYTPTLLRLNEAYFLGNTAPPFVLLKLEAVDQRYPTSEDALALLALWRNYRPVELEQGFVLLERVRETRTPLATTATEYVDVAPGEWINVPAAVSPQLLHGDIALSTLGRVFATLLREPELRAEVQLDNGETRQFRLLRSTAAAGFLLTPFFADERAYVHWFYGERQPAVQRIRLLAPVAWQQHLLAPRFRIGFVPLDLPREQAATLPPGLVAALYPGFDTAPTARSGAIEAVVENGAPALFMHALSTLDFAPAPGRYRLTARYGVRRAAYEAAECIKAQADGIRFQIDVLRDGQMLMQFQRDLNPFASASDQGPQEASTELLTVAPGDALRVTVAPGEHGNGACDWGYLSELRLQPRSP